MLSGVVLIVAVTEQQQQQQEQMKEKPQQQHQSQHGLIHFLCYAVLHVLYYAECCDADNNKSSNELATLLIPFISS
jgi:hypothetical protein